MNNGDEEKLTEHNSEPAEEEEEEEEKQYELEERSSDEEDQPSMHNVTETLRTDIDQNHTLRAAAQREEDSGNFRDVYKDLSSTLDHSKLGLLSSRKQDENASELDNTADRKVYSWRRPRPVSPPRKSASLEMSVLKQSTALDEAELAHVEPNSGLSQSRERPTSPLAQSALRSTKTALRSSTEPRASQRAYKQLSEPDPLELDDENLDIDKLLANEEQHRKSLITQAKEVNTVQLQPPELAPLASAQHAYVSSTPSSRLLHASPAISSEPSVRWQQTLKQLEDEGLYVGQKASYGHHNLPRVELRLLREDPQRQRWFGPNGRLIQLPDPLQPVITRPTRLYNPEATHLDTVFVVPSMSKQLASEMHLGKHHQLDIDIVAVQFTDHPLFTEEEYLAAQLTALFHDFSERFQAQRVPYYNDRLRVLEDELERLLDHAVTDTTASAAVRKPTENNGGERLPFVRPHHTRVARIHRARNAIGRSQKSPEDLARERERRIRVVRESIKRLRKARESEEGVMLQLIRTMKQLNDKLLAVRARQGYTTTRVHFVIESHAVNAEEDRRRYEEEIEREIKELRAEREQEHALRIREYETAHAAWVERQRQRAVYAPEGSRAVASQSGNNHSTEAADEDDDDDDDDDQAGINDKHEHDVVTIHKDRPQRHHEGELLPTNSAQAANGAGVCPVSNAAALQSDVDNDPEPRPPVFEFSDEREKVAIVTRFSETRRAPGEPIEIPHLLFDTPLTPRESCPLYEQRRLAEIERTYVQAQLFVNGRYVTKTKKAPLRPPEYTADIGQIFSLKLLRWPESIVLKLHTATAMSPFKTYVAALRIDPPQPEAAAVQSSGYEPEEIAFVGDQPFAEISDGTGDSLKTTVRYVSGRVIAAAAWVDGSAPASPADAKRRHQVGRELPLELLLAIGTQNGGVDGSKLQAWLEAMDIDPNDPRNYGLLQALTRKVARRPSRSGIDGAQLPIGGIADANPDMAGDELTFASNAVTSKRNRYLQLRREGKVEVQSVPFSEAEISDAMLTPLQPNGDDDSSNSTHTAALLTETRLKMRYRIPPLSERIKTMLAESEETLQLWKDRNAQVRRFAMQEGKRGALHFSDVVIEPVFPDPTASLQALKGVFEQRRKLRPRRKPRATSATAAAVPADTTSYQLFVQVVRAYNVPTRKVESEATIAVTEEPSRVVRKTNTTALVNVPSRTPVAAAAAQPTAALEGDSALAALKQAAAAEEMAALDGGASLSPFVQVVFHEHSQRTRIADGPNPQWNELLILPVDAAMVAGLNEEGGDIATRNNEALKQVIFVELFDEVVVDLEKDDRERDAIYRRIQRRFLGSLAIPFATVYQNGRIEGNFRLKVPPVNLRYNYDAEASSTLLGHLGVVDRNYHNTIISLYITVEPPLQKPEPFFDLASKTIEDPAIVQYALKWVETCNRAIPTPRAAAVKRPVRALVCDLKGQSVLITRFLKALTPPPGVDTVEKVVRFVSLIPLLRESVSSLEHATIWATGQQVLDMRAGSYFDHATLLCSFLLSAQELESYVVLCWAMPEGLSAYVLTVERDSGRTSFWNPVTGDHYEQHDPLCPIRSIGTVFNATNIYVNVQPRDEPAVIMLDFANPKHWKPFFHAKLFPSRTLGSVQIELRYIDTPEQFVKALEVEIEQGIMQSISEYRRRFVTRWSRTCGRMFKDLLGPMEAMMGHNEVVLREHRERMAVEHAEALARLDSYDIIGFPINVPFHTVEGVIEEVLNTDIHKTEDPKAEFATAVHIHAYPNKIASVWVYIAMLTKRL